MANERDTTGSSQRGFASMDDDKQRENASKGGQSVPDGKRSFSQDRDLASGAGRKGGKASHGGSDGSGDDGRQGQGGGQRGGSGNFAGDRERAAEAGRKGGRT